MAATNPHAFTPTAKGTYRWIASYSGDGNNEPVATSCGDPGEEVVVSPRPPPAPPDLTSTLSPSPPTPAGAPIQDTAHLSGGSNPTSTISFHVYGPGNTTCAAPPAGSSTVTVDRGNGDYDSKPFTPTAAGTYRWVASYSGDEHNGPVATSCDDRAETGVVSMAHPALRTVALPVVPIGGAVQDAALLTGGSKARGRITFRLYGPNDHSCTGPPAFITHQTVIGNGAYRSATFAPRQTGHYLWVARYSGDANNHPAATHCGEKRETVVVLARRPLLTSSASPPANLTRGHRVRAAGLSIYDAATLRFGFAPTGEIRFLLFGPNDASCSGTPVFTSATDVAGNGVYNSERFTPTASGTYRWLAAYSGDANNRPAGPTRCGDAAELVHLTLPADTQLATSASDAVDFGGAIHDTAHLSGGSAPTGTITFRLYGAGDNTCSSHPTFTSTVAVDGNNDYTSQSFVPKAAGVYRWVASYSGDARNHRAGPTACGDTAETAIVRPPSIIPVVPAFSTTASPSPELGGLLYDTAHLNGGVDPGGAITFTLFGPDDPTCSTTPAFTTTVTVTGNGNYRSAAFVVPQPGTYRWVATYSGDEMNTAVGPTACGDPAETALVSASPGPNPDPGPNVPPPPKPKPPKPKPKPKRPPPFTPCPARDTTPGTAHIAC